MNLQEIKQKKEALFEAQQKINEELRLLDESERTAARAERKEGMAKIKQLIIDFQIPKYEMDNMYKDTDLSFVKQRKPRELRSKVDPSASPQLDKVAKNKDRADQYNRLVATNNLTLLKAKIKSIGDEVEDVLPYVDAATEAAIIGCLP